MDWRLSNGFFDPPIRCFGVEGEVAGEGELGYGVDDAVAMARQSVGEVVPAEYAARFDSWPPVGDVIGYGMVIVGCIEVSEVERRDQGCGFG